MLACWSALGRNHLSLSAKTRACGAARKTYRVGFNLAEGVCLEHVCGWRF
jgi:hypothetical protein